MAKHSAASPRTPARAPAPARPAAPRRSRAARAVDAGDVAPSLNAQALENDRVNRATERTQTVAAMALADVLATTPTARTARPPNGWASCAPWSTAPRPTS
jgi:hypothetical protein